MPTSPLTVYDASAGSGKTFTLVKEYLKILFRSPHKDHFKYVLAITFTNKAVGEMKARILEALKAFSKKEIISEPNSLFKALCSELNTDEVRLHEKSQVILNTIMHNYAAFDISTIDGFNHRLIRTFAHDLKLPLNFEVELDVKALVAEAVDRLIAQAGSDKALTKVLVDFALEKADDDKSWDVARDFNAMASILINENDLKYVKTLEHKSLEDFGLLKKELQSQISVAETEVKSTAEQILDQINKAGLDFSDFSRSTLPNHFKKAAELNLKDLYKNQLENKISENNGLYIKSLDDEKKQLIDALLPHIDEAFHKTKVAVFQLKFLRNFYKNLSPLSVLNAINKELNLIKAEQNKMLISEFNSIISSEISKQPTPFIYERLGEKFRHYFIDEFQDTSEMQWQNLIPLIDNSLTSEDLRGQQGSAMIVGDAKQAIYRWRGGKAEQFIDLYNAKTKPFQIDQKRVHLEYNYRSFKNIVQFNNSFFKYISEYSFSNTDYSNLYKAAIQNEFIEDLGYVDLSFIAFEKEDNKDEVYPQRVLETIQTCLENAYELKDICILIRKKKEGLIIAEYLAAEGYKISSSETMLLDNAPEVQFINSLLVLLINSEDYEARISCLNFLADQHNIEDKHDYFKRHINLELSELFKSFEHFDIFLDPQTLIQYALFDLVESLVRAFKLVKDSNAYLQYYLDHILEYSQKHISDVSGFLDYYEKQKSHLSIVSPQDQNAVQIMTIHKSKGLEFPVVIFPYAQLDIYQEIEPKAWYKLDSEKYQGFSHTLLNYNRDFEFYGSIGAAIHEQHQAELELDNLNLLYVALTRPVEQLYIIGKKDINAKGLVNNKTYSGLLINYLIDAGLWSEAQLNYSFGSQKKESQPATTESHIIEQSEFISTAKEDHNIKVIAKSGYLWDTEQQDAIEKGNLIHDIMAEVKTEADIDFVISDFLNSGLINREQAIALTQAILQIVRHPDLEPYFNAEHLIYNERDIITKTGQILRPDRLVIKANRELIIIDYKTGLHNPKYQHQLQEYQDVLEDMNYSVIKKLLVYINESIIIRSY